MEIRENVFPPGRLRKSPVSQRPTEKVFYENIGTSEPYHVNQYVRPKSLATFKLMKSPSENELDFLKRRELQR